MSAFSDTPSLVASGDCTAYRFVKISGRNTGITCASISDIAIGVADGSSKSFPVAGGTNLHAAAGDPITLQGGNVVLVEAGGVVNAGMRVSPNGSGQAIRADPTAYPFGIALEPAAAAGQIIRVFKHSVTVIA